MIVMMAISQASWLQKKRQRWDQEDPDASQRVSAARHRCKSTVFLSFLLPCRHAGEYADSFSDNEAMDEATRQISVYSNVGDQERSARVS